MKRTFSGLTLALTLTLTLALIPAFVAMPALAGVEAVPAPAIGLALPAVGAVILVALIALLLKHIKI
jgi:hypothetical protein